MKSTKFSLAFSTFVILGYLLILALPSGFSATQTEIPLTIIKDASVRSIQMPDASVSTSFYIRLSGPSPEDISSCVVEGPSGSVDLHVSSHRDNDRCDFLIQDRDIFDLIKKRNHYRDICPLSRY